MALNFNVFAVRAFNESDALVESKDLGGDMPIKGGDEVLKTNQCGLEAQEMSGAVPNIQIIDASRVKDYNERINGADIKYPKENGFANACSEEVQLECKSSNMAHASHLATSNDDYKGLIFDPGGVERINGAASKVDGLDMLATLIALKGAQYIVDWRMPPVACLLKAIILLIVCTAITNNEQETNHGAYDVLRNDHIARKDNEHTAHFNADGIVMLPGQPEKRFDGNVGMSANAIINVAFVGNGVDDEKGVKVRSVAQMTSHCECDVPHKFQYADADAIKGDDGGSLETFAERMELRLHKDDWTDTFEAYAMMNQKSRDTIPPLYTPLRAWNPNAHDIDEFEHADADAAIKSEPATQMTLNIKIEESIIGTALEAYAQSYKLLRENEKAPTINAMKVEAEVDICIIDDVDDVDESVQSDAAAVVFATINSSAGCGEPLLLINAYIADDAFLNDSKIDARVTSRELIGAVQHELNRLVTTMSVVEHYFGFKQGNKMIALEPHRCHKAMTTDYGDVFNKCKSDALRGRNRDALYDDDADELVNSIGDEYAALLSEPKTYVCVANIKRSGHLNIELLNGALHRACIDVASAAVSMAQGIGSEKMLGAVEKIDASPTCDPNEINNIVHSKCTKPCSLVDPLQKQSQNSTENATMATLHEDKDKVRESYTQFRGLAPRHPQIASRIEGENSSTKINEQDDISAALHQTQQRGDASPFDYVCEAERRFVVKMAKDECRSNNDDPKTDERSKANGAVYNDDQSTARVLAGPALSELQNQQQPFYAPMKGRQSNIDITVVESEATARQIEHDEDFGAEVLHAQGREEGNNDSLTVKEYVGEAALCNDDGGQTPRDEFDPGGEQKANEMDRTVCAAIPKAEALMHDVFAMVPRPKKGGNDHGDEEVMAHTADGMDLPSAAPISVASLCSSKTPSKDEARGEEPCETLRIMADGLARQIDGAKANSDGYKDVKNNDAQFNKATNLKSTTMALALKLKMKGSDDARSRSSLSVSADSRSSLPSASATIDNPLTMPHATHKMAAPSRRLNDSTVDAHVEVPVQHEMAKRMEAPTKLPITLSGDNNDNNLIIGKTHTDDAIEADGLRKMKPMFELNIESEKAKWHSTLALKFSKKESDKFITDEDVVDGAKDYDVATSPNPHTATTQIRALSSEGDDSSEAWTYKVKMRDKQGSKDILMDCVGDNEQLKAALIIIVAMSGTVNNCEGSMTGKGSEPVKYKTARTQRVSCASAVIFM